MRTISDQCAFREVVPGVGAFPSKVLPSRSLRSSVNMILLRMRSLNRSSHRSNLRNLPSQQQEYFQFFKSVCDCACRRAGAGEEEEEVDRRPQKETKTDQELSSRHDHTIARCTIARSLVCPSASVLCGPVSKVHHFQTLLDWIKSRSAISI